MRQFRIVSPLLNTLMDQEEASKKSKANAITPKQNPVLREFSDLKDRNVLLLNKEKYNIKKAMLRKNRKKYLDKVSNNQGSKDSFQDLMDKFIEESPYKKTPKEAFKLDEELFSYIQSQKPKNIKQLDMQWRDKMFLFQKLEEKIGGNEFVDKNISRIKSQLKKEDYYENLKNYRKAIQNKKHNPFQIP